MEKNQSEVCVVWLRRAAALLAACACLSGGAQAQDSVEEAPVVALSEALLNARTERAELLAAPYVAGGMDRAEAFTYAWIAVVAEAQGQGDAETLMREMVSRKELQEDMSSLSHEEVAMLLKALENTDRADSLSSRRLAKALMEYLVGWMRTENPKSFAASARGGASMVSQVWWNRAWDYGKRTGDLMPSVWWQRHEGGLRQDWEDMDYGHPPFGHVFLSQVPFADAPAGTLQRRKGAAGNAVQTLSLEEEEEEEIKPEAKTAAAEAPAPMMLSMGGGSSAGGGARMLRMAAFSPALQSLDDDPAPAGGAPAGNVTWKGSSANLKDGANVTFNNDSTGKKYLDVELSDVWRPYSITVNDQDVTASNRGGALGGKVGYAFTGSGSIGDYVDEQTGEVHPTTITKDGTGILVLTNPGNSYSGGTVVKNGTLYVAEQGALGTGAVTLHNGTEMWVNYLYSRDYSSSFRSPVVSNTIQLADGASSSISYGAFPYKPLLGVNNGVSTRIWRNMYLTGGITGNAGSHLFLQSYNSRYGSNNFSTPRLHLGGSPVSIRGELWYGGFILNRAEALTKDERFYGTVTLGNRINVSGEKTDRLSDRETGAVKLTLSDDVLEYATLDATREWNWYNVGESTGYGVNNKLLLTGEYSGGSITPTVSQKVKNGYADAGGTESNYDNYGLRQTHSHTILVSDNTKIGELKADLLGVTQDSYRDAIDWSESLEVGMVRVATLDERATLTLGKTGGAESWFSGTVGFENLLCDFDGDGKDTMTKANMNGLSDTPTTKVGISLVKVGDNAQYIHSAKLLNLDVQNGTLGFNNVNLVNNLTLTSGAKLQLGVQNEQWKEAGSVSLQVGETETGLSHRLEVVTNKTDEDYADAPFSARVEGSLKLNASTEIAFEVNSLEQESGERDEIVPAWVMEDDTFRSTLKEQAQNLSDHSLLQVTAATQRTDADKGGVLTLNNASHISLAGVNFLSEKYENKVYFLAAADKIEVDTNGTIGTASDFDARVITLGYGYYGLISAIDGHGTTIGGEYVTYDTDHDFYLGQDYLVLRVAADPTRSWTGSGTTSSDHAANVWTAAPDENYTAYMSETGTGQKPDAQWKENRAYTDGVSVKFGNLWMPTTWEEYLVELQDKGATLQDYEEKLNSSQVTKVGETLFSDAPISEDATRTPNGTEVSYGGLSYGTNGSTYDPARTEDPSRHFEQVVIEGMVRPGYVTINSDFNLKQEDGSYVTVKDDTNYVFTGSGWIADASAETMQEIYKNQLGEGVSSTILDGWKTGLAKGGTGTLVMETQNTYSGGTLLQGGLTVMKNMWALGMENPTANFDDPDPAKRFAAADAKGGRIEMSYGAGLMADYITENGVLDQLENTIRETVLTNDLTITHMADFDNTGATGDAQLLNRYDAVMVVHTLSSYDDAILTLRGVSLEADDPRAHKEGDEHTYYTFSEYMIASPENAYGTIRMAGYLQGADGALVDPAGDAYMYGGGKVQLTLTGHTSSKIDHPHWSHTTIDLSLNGGADNVLALDTRFIANNDATAAVENTKGLPLYVFLGTLKDDGNSGHHARVINDASSERLGTDPKNSYVVNLTLSPNTDASFSGDVGFGIGQNGAGAALPSRGYISLTKTGAAAQSIGNARLLDLKVEGTGLMHFNENLSARTITTANVGAQHIHVGEVEDASMSHTLTVGKGGVLSFDTTIGTQVVNGKSVAIDPLSGLLATESNNNYGAELTYVLLKDGATITGSGNWYTDKGISVVGGANITFNTHDYSMDETVSSEMEVFGPVGANLQTAFDDSHIFWLNRALSGDKVTLNLVNEQMSAGATEDERGKAKANGYIITHDLNQYETANAKVFYGLQGGSTVNIGANTIMQSYADAKNDSGIIYNISGTDAALQFLDAKSNKLDASAGYMSYVSKATLSEGGSIILGGAAAVTTATTQNTDSVKTDITADADVVITHKAGQTASIAGMKVNTKNAATNGVTYETTLSDSTGKGRAQADGIVLTVREESNPNKTLMQRTDLLNSLVYMKEQCSVTMEDVLLRKDSKVQGAGPADGLSGAAAVQNGATAASDQSLTAVIPGITKGSLLLTDAATQVNVTLSNTQYMALGKGAVQVTRADQLARTDVGGAGLTLGLSAETLAQAAEAGMRYLAIQVSDSGRFLYETEGNLAAVKLVDFDKGVEYTAANSPYWYKVVGSDTVAADLGVSKAEVSDTLLYIEVSNKYTPEPATAALSLLALAGLMSRRRRPTDEDLSSSFVIRNM